MFSNRFINILGALLIEFKKLVSDQYDHLILSQSEIKINIASKFDYLSSVKNIILRVFQLPCIPFKRIDPPRRLMSPVSNDLEKSIYRELCR